MKTSGIFFLRGRPSSVRLVSPTAGWVPGWLFSLGERTSHRGVAGFTAIWRGPEADRFIQANPQLRAGHCLRLELDRLHATNNELRGHVVSCELAPPRWPEPEDTPATPHGAESAIENIAAHARMAGVAADFHH
ncbi:hypothetical protein DBA29_17205 [Xenophilus aerolatus]|nr:hypothetical protein [Xenophilus aerolatus]